MLTTFTNLSSIISKGYVKPVPTTRNLFTGTTINAAGISPSGASIVFCNGNSPSNVYVSTDYGATFVQKTNIPVNAVTGRENAVISDSGQYIWVYKPYSANTANIVYSSDYGATWSTTSLACRIFAVNISASGQYVVASGDSGTGGGIWVSTNYGASFTSKLTNNTAQGNYVSATGQYCIVNFNIGTAGSYIYYSSDYLATFTQVTCMGSGAYGRRAYISSTGDFMFLTAAGTPNTFLSVNKTSTFTQPSGTVATYLNSQMTSGLDKECNICSNADGSQVYFTKSNNSNYLWKSIDFLQTASLYYAQSGSDGKIRASSDCKYMLLWATNALVLLTNP